MLPKQAWGTDRKHATKPFPQPAARLCTTLRCSGFDIPFGPSQSGERREQHQPVRERPRRRRPHHVLRDIERGQGGRQPGLAKQAAEAEQRQQRGEKGRVRAVEVHGRRRGRGAGNGEPGEESKQVCYGPMDEYFNFLPNLFGV